MDGHLRLYEEGNGRLHLHHSLENAFGPGVGITRIKSVPSLSLIVATGACAVSEVVHVFHAFRLLVRSVLIAVAVRRALLQLL
jgi:hypothetical protein